MILLSISAGSGKKESQAPSPERAPRHRLSWRSLMLRIPLALAAVGLLPLALASWQLVRINREAFSDQVQKTHSVAAGTAAERVASYLDSLTTVADSLAENALLTGDARSVAAQELLVSMLQARPDIGALAVVDETGELVIRAQRRDLGTEMEAALAAKDAHEVAMLTGTLATWLRLDRALGGAHGRLRMVVEAAPLIAAVERAEIGSDEADLVLSRRDGGVIAGTTSSLDGFPPDLLATANSGRLSGAGVYPGASGERVVGAFAPVGRQDWVVISRQPQRFAEQIRLAMQRDSLLAVLVAGLLVAALSTVAHFSLVQPIRTLSRAQRRLAGAALGPGDRDEISDLKESFELLERRVRDSEDIGRVFLGRYQVIEPVGSGAMGSVFLGWDPKLQRKVALKTVRLDSERMGLRRGELSQKLLQEAVTTARFNHPNIVSVYDVEASKEVAFLAMEFVDGVGLEWVLWRQRPLSEERTVLVGHAIASALAEAHGQGIVHRDVKPSNVLLDLDGPIKVTDFGISELITAVSNPSETFFGTPGYVPPETLRGEGYGPRGDLFALGVILYEALAGFQPFVRAELRQTMAATLETVPEPLRSVRPELSPEITEVVGGLLHKDPDKRTSSALDVVRSLERIIIKRALRWNPADLPRKPETAALADGHSQLFPTVSGRR